MWMAHTRRSRVLDESVRAYGQTITHALELLRREHAQAVAVSGRREKWRVGDVTLTKIVPGTVQGVGLLLNVHEYTDEEDGSVVLCCDCRDSTENEDHQDIVVGAVDGGRVYPSKAPCDECGRRNT